MLVRILVGAIIIIVLLKMCGQDHAASSVASGTLGLVKWIAIIGVVVFVIIGITSNKNQS